MGWGGNQIGFPASSLGFSAGNRLCGSESAGEEIYSVANIVDLVTGKVERT